MRLMILPAILLGMASANVNAQQEDGKLDSLFSTGSVKVGDRELLYRLLAPPKIEDGVRYPLVLFLHGMGERGSDNESQLKYLPEKLASPNQRMKHPCFLLAPQCPSDSNWNDVDWRSGKAATTRTETWTERALVAALQEVVRHNAIDVDRIYLTGLSMGGYGAWRLATRYPDWFAACVPVCGGGDPQMVRRMAKVPVWAWHGADDRVVPSSESAKMIDALRHSSSPARFSKLAGVGHNSWAAAYGKRGAIDWMFKQVRKSPGLLAGLEMMRRTKLIRNGERIVFLGDSITQAGDRVGGFVQLIRAALQGRGDLVDVKVIGAGISGHRVPDLEKRLQRDVLDKNPSVVFIYIGINDVWHSTSGRGTSANDYEAGLGSIIDRIKAAGATVVLATPSVIGERANGVNKLDGMLDRYAELSRRVAVEKQVDVLDLRVEMTDYLSVLNPQDAEKGVLTTDGVHLNRRGNRFVADRAARGIVEALEKRRSVLPTATISGEGWPELTLADFVNVNGKPDTWTQAGRNIVCTGIPLGGARSKKKYSNFELVLEWKHHKHAGNSGIFLWCPDQAFVDLEPGKLPRSGIEVQVLDLGYEENWRRNKKSHSNWFTSHGDVFPVGSSKMTAMTPKIQYTDDKGESYWVGHDKSSRSFPTKRLTRGIGQWNHYYIRAINGEVRLWVNGTEVNGGSQCSPSTGYLALESEGSLVEFRNIRLRELP